jgi:hypothetical protein
MGFFRRDEPGVRAQAKLLGLGPTARGARRTGALDVEMQLRLAVTMPDGGVVETDHLCKVPHEKSPIVGDTLPVEVDPAERTVKKVLFDEMPRLEDRARASAAAAQAGDSAGAAAALGFKLKE